MYTFKKLVGMLCQPGSLALLLAACAAVLTTLRRPRSRNWLLWISAVVFVLPSTSLVGAWLLAPLEQSYPPLHPLPATVVVHYVVVLGSSYLPREDLPISATIDGAGFKRLVEGVRLQRMTRGARLVVSGGAVAGGGAPAVGNRLMALQLGVPEQDIIALTRPLDTRSEAQEVMRLIGTQPFYLVTSAGHMPRAIECMRLAGGNPIAAPTDYYAMNTHFRWSSLVPSSNGLRMSELALHEYLGWLALKAGIN